VAKTFGTSALFGRRSGVLDPSGPVLPDGRQRCWGCCGGFPATAPPSGGVA